jgi:hypothetical protein
VVIAIFAKVILSKPGDRTVATGHGVDELSTDSVVRPPRLPLVRGLLLALPGIPDKTGYPAAIAGETVGNPRQSAARLGAHQGPWPYRMSGRRRTARGGVADSLDEAKAALDGAPGRDPVSEKSRRDMLNS